MVILGVATADAIFVFPDGNSHIEPIRPNLSTTIFIFLFSFSTDVLTLRH